MILLIAFAFLAGVITILSPCILPILPIVLSSTIGGANTGKSRPLGVVTGFVLSFTFFTLFLSTIVRLLNIPGDSLRLFSIIIIAGFGVSLLIPQFQILMERLFSRLQVFAPKVNTQPSLPAGRQGFVPGFLIGLSLGLLWTPCVGPILASVISLAITGTVDFSALLITLAYAAGTAIPMFIIMIGGQNVLRKVPWLLANTDKIQKVFGILMILTAVGIFTNVDRKFQTFVLNIFPQYGAGLTKFEDNTAVRNQLDALRNKKTQEQTVKKENMGKPMFDLLQPKGTKAPELIPGGIWINTNGLTLEQLRGKVVIVDFWTYSCINCQRTLPYLKKWHETYSDKGLVIIGVHAPEFEFEKNADNVRKAVVDFGLTYPIMQDNNFATWRAYDNHYWPAKYIIDKEGYIRYTHFGEGAYDESERVIQELLKEAGAKGINQHINNPQYENYARTPETYLGYGRLANFASREQIVPDTITAYTPPALLLDNNVAYEGKWAVMTEYANPQQGASLVFNFEAKEVFLVMRPKGPAEGPQPSRRGRVKVAIDDKTQSLGADAVNGVVTVDSDRLYKLIKLETPGRHILRLEFQDSNTEVYAFTFG